MPGKTKLNEKTKGIILEYIRKGNYIKTACLAAGVCEDTFYTWVQKGERGGGNGDEVYTDFLLDLKKARASNIAYNIDIIQQAGPKNWTASAWLLERMNPAEYGKRLELEVGPSKVLIALQEQARQDRLPEVKVLDKGVTDVV